MLRVKRNSSEDWTEATNKMSDGMTIREVADEWGVTTTFVRVLLAIPNPHELILDHMCHMCSHKWQSATKYYQSNCPACKSKTWRLDGRTRYAV